jgi:hypothetical protein
MQRNEHTLAIELCERTYASRQNRSLPFHMVRLLETLAAAHEAQGHALKSLQCREQIKRLNLGTYADGASGGYLEGLIENTSRGARRSVPA